jgi:DNA repair protein RecN (Recombination protein N)
MLKKLSVDNFALIDNLQLDFPKGFSVITGETGAGKSILLGALGHLLGDRADLKALRDPAKKCIIEGVFLLDSKKFLLPFKEHDLDFEEESIIRREIQPSGKSRAFINDTPVRLDVLTKITERLIDVHSQHDTLLLNNTGFQLELIDSFALNTKQGDVYQKHYLKHVELLKSLKLLEAEQREEGGDADYRQFLFEELESAQLIPGEQEDIEGKLAKLEHVGSIESAVSEALKLAQSEPFGISESLKQSRNQIKAVARFDKGLASLAERLSSLSIEFEDIRAELEQIGEDSTFNPQEKESLDLRLSQLMGLQKKHLVASNEELIAKKLEIEESIVEAINRDDKLTDLRQQVEAVLLQLLEAATVLRNSRQAVLAKLQSSLEKILSGLNMADAQFIIEISESANFTPSGKDDIRFLFSANLGQKPALLNKIASGGELSRVMLALKAILSRTKSLPTIIFDEIDTGVSGATARKIADILADMGKDMQVISISHLAQIAAKGESHFKVWKENLAGKTQTRIQELSADQRLKEIARLLSGEEITEAALANARQLIGG